MRQRIYIDAVTGFLGYESPQHAAPEGAVFVNFLHNGKGTTIYKRHPSGGRANPPGTFQWLGALWNPYWMACPRPGAVYQLMKYITTGGELFDNPGSCTVLTLAALDWSGTGAAAGVYL